jgi:peroxiredoxin
MRISIFLFLFFLSSNGFSQSFLIDNQSDKKVYTSFQEYDDSIESYQKKDIYNKTMHDSKLGWIMIYIPVDNILSEKLIYLFAEDKTDRKIIISKTNEVIFVSNKLEMDYNSHLHQWNNGSRFQELEALIKEDKEGLKSIVYLKYELCNTNCSWDTIQYFFNKIPQKVQQSYWGQDVLNYIQLCKNLEIGHTINDFKLSDTTNQIIALSEIKSDYVLLDFWFSTCKPCLASFPELLELYHKTDRKKLEIVGISIDKESQKSLWLSRIRQYKLNWINLIDPKREVAYKTLAIPKYPTKILIDKNRRIISINPTDTDIEKIISK